MKKETIFKTILNRIKIGKSDSVLKISLCFAMVLFPLFSLSQTIASSQEISSFQAIASSQEISTPQIIHSSQVKSSSSITSQSYTIKHTPKIKREISEDSKRSFTNRNMFFPLYDTITISFIGDVMQHTPQIRAAREVAKLLGDSSQYNYSNTFKNIENMIVDCDYMVANMELTIGNPPYSGYPMFSSPPEIAHQAQKSGIDLFLLANNHIADKGAKGIEKTLALYRSLGVQTTGVYLNQEEEERSNPLIIDIKGVRFALFNFTYGTNGLIVPSPYIVCLEDTTHIKRVIERAKRKGADFIIALPHWGLEYHLQPSDGQKKLANYMFDLGVDAIVGGHPHVTQPIVIKTNGKDVTYTVKGDSEVVQIVESENISTTLDDKKRVIFYSLGNYVSNQSKPTQTQIGMFATLRFRKNTLTGEKEMIAPKWVYTYCYRPGEYLPNDYVVTPLF